MRLLLPPERAKRGIIRETCLIIRVEFLFACIWRNIWRHRAPFEYSKKWIFSQTVCTLCEEKTWRLKNGKHIRASNYSDFNFVCKVIYNYTKGIRKKIFESVIDPLLRKKKKKKGKFFLIYRYPTTKSSDFKYRGIRSCSIWFPMDQLVETVARGMENAGFESPI